MSPERVPPRATVFTYDDYRRLPGDGVRRELVEGVFEAVPGPEPGHQDVSRNLELILAACRTTGSSDRMERALEAYRLVERRYELEARVTGDAEFRPSLFPGLVMPLAEVWE